MGDQRLTGIGEWEGTESVVEGFLTRKSKLPRRRPPCTIPKSGPS